MKLVRIAALTAVLGLLAGCRLDILPRSREIDSVALMRTMGVDRAEENAGGTQVQVTVSSGVQSKGGDAGEEPPVVASQTAGTVSGALLSMQAGGASYLFYGHVGQLLLGEALARQDASPALEYVLRDIEMRLDTMLYLIKDGTAGEAITGTASEDSSAAQRLDAMEQDAGRTSHAAPKSVGQVLSDLSETGASCVPALTIQTDGEEQNLEAVGYGILKDGVLAAWTTEEEARGISLLQGSVETDVVELTCPDGNSIALRVVGVTNRFQPVFQGNQFVGLEIQCCVDANLAEAGPDITLDRVELERTLAKVEEERARAALTLCQRLDADVLHLEQQAGLTAPWYWRAIQEQWNLPALEFSLSVEAHIMRGYDVRSA